MTRQTLLRLFFLLALIAIPMHALAGPNAIEKAPAQDGITQIEYSTKQTSKWTDLPIGTYRVPNSDVIISGHQKGGAAPMLLFGVVGLAVQNSINAKNGKEAMASAEQALTLSIDDEAKAVLARLIAEPDNAAKFTMAETEHKFEVTGAVVLSFANQAEALPYVTLRVKLLDKNGKKLWTTRYIASEGGRRPVVGEGSWTENGGAPLRANVSKNIETAIRTMLRDVSNPYPREEASLLTAKGFFPHVNKPLQVVGYKLAEENGQILFLPKLSTTIVFAGVNVLTPDTMTLAPTQPKDAPLKLLKPNDPSLPVLARASANPTPAGVAEAADTSAAGTSAEETTAEQPLVEEPEAVKASDGGN
jgi:hypothetical protein